MKRMLLAVAAIFCITLHSPVRAGAQVVPMSDEAMSSVTGQGGIVISTQNLNFDVNADTIYYKDSDGIGPGTTAGFLSLTDVSMRGSVAFSSPMTIEVATARDKNLTEIKGIKMTIPDMTLKIDSFLIDAIRLGSAPGKGNSLGSIGIENLIVRTTGGITIASMF